MESLVALTLALVAITPWRSSACPFGGIPGMQLPPDHPFVKNQGRRLFLDAFAKFPGYIEDPTGTMSEGTWSHIWNYSGMGIVGDDRMEASDMFMNIKRVSEKHNDAEVCYMSIQTLPSPTMLQENPFVHDEDVEMWFQVPSPDGNRSNFMAHAVKRMHAFIKEGGPVVWQTSAVGRTLRNKVCEQNRVPTFGLHEDCQKDSVKNQQLMTPTAINILKVQASKAQETWDFHKTWRSSMAEGHYYEMNSDLVHKKGWGSGGQVVSKIVLCSDLPDKFKYKNLHLDETISPSGKLWSDEAFQYWQSLCSIDNPKCQTNGGEVAITTTEPPSRTTTQTATSAAASLHHLWFVVVMVCFRYTVC
eukprot:gnl/MRDRNA2_/MRDRNA2_88185_c0_seq1.p1 gnl/MRDRNA2_/MRDRNA2_88185_c0~~gnl/MRDRNA2_/MRDRNA2_88185_c0_seq1.p1  ORF type:complete len:360 (+),score=65.12 gnl/MRDRNA2_/MRDRNA2_88185_c0_seq1:111-1190(+)